MLKWERFKVSYIHYDDNRCIDGLIIIDKTGKEVFHTGEIEELEPDIPDEETFPKANNTVPAAPPTNDVKAMIERELETMMIAYGFADTRATLAKFTEWRNALMESGALPKTKKITSIDEARATFDAIYRNFKPSDGEIA